MAEDKRVRRTKKLLRQALAELMQEKEFQNITVSDVVRRADINRGTFYAYYRDVFDLREKVENEMLDTLYAAADEYLIGPNDFTIQPLIAYAVGYLLDNYDLVYALLRDSGIGSFEDKLMGFMEACSRKLRPPRSQEDCFAIWFAAAGSIGLLKKWMTQPEPAPREAVIRRMDELLCSILNTVQHGSCCL